MKVPSSPETPPPKVNWLRFCSSHLELDVELVLADVARQQLGSAFHGLEVAELVDAPDRELERLGVEDVALVQVDLAADHLVAGGVVAGEA